MKCQCVLCIRVIDVEELRRAEESQYIEESQHVKESRQLIPAWLSALGNVQIQSWCCPNPTHRDVIWNGDTAQCGICDAYGVCDACGVCGITPEQKQQKTAL